MKCRFCGEELPEGAMVCPRCQTPAEIEETELPADDVNQEPGASEQRQPESANLESNNPGQRGTDFANPEPVIPGKGQRDSEKYQYGAPEPRQPDSGRYQYGSPQPSDGNPNHYRYGAQEPGNQGEPGGGINGTPYMIFAIITTLLCCLPLGVAAIIYAGKINTYQRRGDYAGAHDAADKARLFSIIGAAGGLVVMVIYIAAFVIGVREYRGAEGSGVVENLPPFETELQKPAGGESGDDAGKQDSIKEEQKDETAAAPAEAKRELGDTWETYTVQINEKVVTLPCRIEELEAAGLEMDEDEMPDDFVINAQDHVAAYFEDEDDNYIIVDLVNMSDDRTPAEKCLVGSITAMDYSVAEEGRGITVILPGGIRIGTPQDEVLDKYGKTDDVYEGDNIHTYTWHGDEEEYPSKCEIEIDAESRIVTTVRIRNFR